MLLQNVCSDCPLNAICKHVETVNTIHNEVNDAALIIDTDFLSVNMICSHRETFFNNKAASNLVPIKTVPYIQAVSPSIVTEPSGHPTIANSSFPDSKTGNDFRIVDSEQRKTVPAVQCPDCGCEYPQDIYIPVICSECKRECCDDCATFDPPTSRKLCGECWDKEGPTLK